jgi:methylmalonyl-CoA mutase N-terminal domain/subunit
MTRDAKERYLEKIRAEKSRKPVFTTLSGRAVAPLYTREDTAGIDWDASVGLPGGYPFTRGVYPTMYRGRLWTMRQYSGFSTAQESNKRYKYLLSQGQTGLSVAFDLPTQLGYDSDDPLAAGEVGKVGVAIDSLADMETLFEGLPLDQISTSMTINSTASILLAMYLALAEKQAVPFAEVRGTVQNDILKEYIARGTYIYPPVPSLRLVTDIIAFCGERAPKFNTISISGYHIREAGATAAQELAFTFANAIAYVEAARGRGMDVDAFAPRLSFFFNAHNHLLEEIAKFRAARRVWAGLMRDRFGAKQEDSLLLRFHTQTAGSMLTAQQPENNIVRVCLQALAAVAGGTQSLHTNAFDEALALPAESSAKIALRTQQILAHESGIADSVDPFAGSWLIEKWTDEIVHEVLAYLKKIDELGGALAAIQSGFPQKEIQESAYRYQKELESGERVVVGVNQFVERGERELSLLRIPPEVEADQKARLAALRSRRDRGAVARRLDALCNAAGGRENLMPPILDAVKAYATVGEISNVLRGVFGEHRDTHLF